MNEKQCGCGSTKLNMVFACSGASDVGGITDAAARQISREKTASMSCIAAIGAGIPDITAKVKCADQILVIDGCDKNCGKVIMEDAGIFNFKHLLLLDLGLKKGESPINEERIALAVQKGRQEFAG